MMKKIAVISIALVGIFGSHAQANPIICVLDYPESSTYAKTVNNYVKAAKSWGVTITLRTYGLLESGGLKGALDGFESGQCDGVMVDFSRSYLNNNFLASIGAAGAVPSNTVLREVMKLVSRPPLAHEMVQGSQEVAGVIPLGSIYPIVNDRSLSSMAKWAGKRIAFDASNKSLHNLAIGMGALDKSEADILTRTGAFKNGFSDITDASASMVKVLELRKGIGTKGAIIRYPISQTIGGLIIRPEAFPTGYGQKSREWFASQLPSFMEDIEREEQSLPAKYWMDVSAVDQQGYVKYMREARIKALKEGVYNPKMLSLLKKVRCRNEPTHWECALRDE